jgi:hypothetical protein
MEYLFEKYIDFNTDKVFLGYKRIVANSSEEALFKAKEKEDELISFIPVANPSNFSNL